MAISCFNKFHAAGRRVSAERGMAILITLTVCTFLLIFCVTLFEKNKATRMTEFKIKESLRAQFLAKGAVQMALLKVRELPTEYYDAVRWYKGWVNESGSGGDIRKFIPNISTTVASTPNYLDYYIGFRKTGEVGEKIVGVTLPPAPDHSDLSYTTDAADPFRGECVVKQMNLLTQYRNNREDSIEFVSEGMEDSGNTYMMKANLAGFNVSQYNSVYRKTVKVGYMIAK